MPAKPFIALEIPNLSAQMAGLEEGIRSAGARAEEALKRGMTDYAEDMLAEAIDRAPVGSGELRGSGTTVGPEQDGTEISVYIGFNKVYARMRDLGGIIRPVRAKALFIPIREGVRPGQPGLVWGEDFVLTQLVQQKGNKYLTGTLERRKGTAAATIARVMKAYLVEAPTNG